MKRLSLYLLFTFSCLYCVAAYKPVHLKTNSHNGVYKAGEKVIVWAETGEGCADDLIFTVEENMSGTIIEKNISLKEGNRHFPLLCSESGRRCRRCHRRHLQLFSMEAVQAFPNFLVKLPRSGNLYSYIGSGVRIILNLQFRILRQINAFSFEGFFQALR